MFERHKSTPVPRGAKFRVKGQFRIGASLRAQMAGRARCAVSLAILLALSPALSPTCEAATAKPSQSRAPPPYPRPRPPEQVAAPTPPLDPSPQPTVSACVQNLRAGIAVIQAITPIQGPGECGIADPVKLEAVWSRGGRKIAVKPAATLSCDMAAAFSAWVRHDLVESAPETKPQLAAVIADAAFDCRGRNRIPGAKISQHGFGAAIDVRALQFADGKQIGLTDAAADKPLRERLQASACARFTTVLGPGSDGYHDSHIHLDVIQRRHGGRICQWEIR
jgi:hypothetical protein